MPRAFLITNKRYSSVVDDEEYSWSRESSPETDVSMADGPLFIDNGDSSNDFDESDYQPMSPTSPANDTSSKDLTSSGDSSSDATTASNSTPLKRSSSPVNHGPQYVTGGIVQPYILQAAHPPLSTIISQPCVISCCYTNADLMAVIQQLMRQNPTSKKIRSTTSTVRPEIRPKTSVTKKAEVASSTLARDIHVCPECGKRYSTSSNLARHRQTHRSVTDKKARKCPHCDKIYVSMPAYSMHVRTHSQGCQCPYCGKCFSRAWLLQGHIRVHTGEKPFSCKVCDKAFADKSNLRAHIQTHSNSKPYLCERCGKAFALKSYLYKHEESSCMRSHNKLQEKSSAESSPNNETSVSPSTARSR